MSADIVWTAEKIRALGARVNGVTAVRIVYGVGETKAREMLRAGEVGFKVIKVPGAQRARYVVPVSAILRALDIADDQAA